MKRIWVSPEDIYHKDVDQPACGKLVYGGNCTRPKEHRGACGWPNWEAHAEIKGPYGGVEVAFSSTHDWRPVSFRNLEEFETFWAAIHTEVKRLFTEVV